MDIKELKRFRNRLGKTQQQMAQLLGVSIKAIHSYERGSRSIPGHVERQVLFLVSRLKDNSKSRKPCWVIKNCPSEKKKGCPAWEFRAGNLCWFINGTICDGTIYKSWKEKMKLCRSCEILKSLLEVLITKQLLYE